MLRLGPRLHMHTFSGVGCFGVAAESDGDDDDDDDDDGDEEDDDDDDSDDGECIAFAP